MERRAPRGTRAALAVLMLSLSGTVTAAAQTAPPAPALPRHEIIFARHGDDARKDYDIWRMCADGTQMASLVVEPGHQFQVTVSPDGTEFAYSSKSDADRDIWKRPFGRGEAVNLTKHPAEDSSPAWSPDGSRIAFFSTRDAEKPELYVLGLADKSVRRITDNPHYESGAAWTPDGKQILMTRFFPKLDGGEHEGAGEIFRIDLATGQEVQLTRLGGYSGDVSLSPDGKSVTFHRVADGRAELWIMGADGSKPRALTDTFVDEYTPRWSPDGNWIAFTAGTGHDGLGTFDLWIMRPDGSHRQVLNRAGNTEAWLEWRPGDHHCR